MYRIMRSLQAVFPQSDFRIGATTLSICWTRRMTRSGLFSLSADTHTFDFFSYARFLLLCSIPSPMLDSISYARFLLLCLTRYIIAVSEPLTLFGFLFNLLPVRRP
jgi:hypothetical protein